MHLFGKDVIDSGKDLKIMHNYLVDFTGTLKPLFGPSMLERLAIEGIAGRYLRTVSN